MDGSDRMENTFAGEIVNELGDGWQERTVRKISEYARREASDDYIGKDGLVYCGKCHTRKQTRVDMSKLNMGVRTVWCTCECYKAEVEAEEAKQRQLRDIQRLQELRKVSLMSERLSESTFDNFTETNDNAHVLRLAKYYAENFDDMRIRDQGLLFWGAPGTGKTYTAACIANYLLDKGIPVVMTSFVKILASVKAFKDGEGIEDYISRFNSAWLLIIDDLATERDTSYATECVYNVIDSRINSKKPLILTTNLHLNEINTPQRGEDKKTFERILQTCYPVEFNWLSWRKKEAANRYREMTKILMGESDKTP